MKISYLLALSLLIHFNQSIFTCENNKQISDRAHNFNDIDYRIRKLQMSDMENLKLLYQKVASIPGGLVRTADEITQEYIEKLLHNGIHRGLGFVAEYNDKLIGSIIKYKLKPQTFSHILTKGSILVDPNFQGRGVGSKLILIFLAEIETHCPEVLRVEIVARETNPAIKLYEKLGFKQEGYFEKRIKGLNGQLEADIPMVWINPRFKLA